MSAMPSSSSESLPLLPWIAIVSLAAVPSTSTVTANPLTRTFAVPTSDTASSSEVPTSVTVSAPADELTSTSIHSRSDVSTVFTSTIAPDWSTVMLPESE